MSKFLFFAAFLLSANLLFAQTFEQKIKIIRQNIKTIRSLRISSNRAIVKHDIDGISKYWLPDFVQTTGRGISTTGKDAAIAGWKDLFETNKTVVYARVPNKIDIADNGTMAWETGSWVAENSYSKGGLYSAMWRKINDTWMLQAELFVSLR